MRRSVANNCAAVQSRKEVPKISGTQIVRRGNTLDGVRRRNLSIVLRRVHEVGAISRAQLTKETGLNRSTIAALVAELVELDLVVENEPDQTSQIGRPSPVIVPSTRPVAITVNPELDVVTVGLVGLGGVVVRRIRYKTTGIPSAVEVTNIAAAIIDGMRGELDANYRVVGIGLAIPGLVRADEGVVALAPHLGWREESICELLMEATGYPVTAANDASLGATAESVWGAGRGVNDLLYLNGGASGIGGGVICGGVLLGGTSGFAGEIGHMLANSEGDRCRCGAHGCLETEVTRAQLLDALGRLPSDEDALEAALCEAYAAGDATVVEVVDRQVKHLGRVLASLANVFNPQLIVVGGFLASLYAANPDPLRAAVRTQSLIGAHSEIHLERARLGQDILTVGAAEMVFEALMRDPAFGAQGRAA